MGFECWVPLSLRPSNDVPWYVARARRKLGSCALSIITSIFSQRVSTLPTLSDTELEATRRRSCSTLNKSTPVHDAEAKRRAECGMRNAGAACALQTQIRFGQGRTLPARTYHGAQALMQICSGEYPVSMWTTLALPNGPLASSTWMLIRATWRIALACRGRTRQRGRRQQHGR